MENRDKYRVIGEVTINTMQKEDYDAFRSVNMKELGGAEFLKVFKRETGYNPASPQGNQQTCHICGQSGSECRGHPIVADVTPRDEDRIYLSEFGIRWIRTITSIICINCKQIIHDKEGIATDIESLRGLPVARKKCGCDKENPKIIQVAEAKIEKEEQEYEWKDGRRRLKKRKKLKLTTNDMISLKLLIEEVSGMKGGPDQLEKLGIKRDNILGLFYNKMVLKPACIHRMKFERGQTGGVLEISGMMTTYNDLFKSVKSGATDKIEELQRSLYVAPKSSRYSGLDSHIATVDGKKGLFRGAAQAKRSRNTGRSVLTPNTYGRSGELSCPKFITANLQHQIKVAQHNKAYLQARVGKEVSHFVIPMEFSLTNARVVYKKITPDTKLKLGDVVLKTVEDGDHVLFHRHPTLHRHSMISYRAQTWNNYVIGLHETNTQGHNADFDGDEGNITVGGNLASRIELAMIDASYNLFGGRSGEPVIGISYNGIVGAFMMCDNNDIAEEPFRELIKIIEMTELHNPRGHMRPYKVNEEYYKQKANEYGDNYYSGRVLISMLLPNSLFYKRNKDVTLKFGLSDGESTARAISQLEKDKEAKRMATHVLIDGKRYPLTKVGEKVQFTFENETYTTNPAEIGTKTQMRVKDVVIENGYMVRGNLRSIDVGNKLITAIAMIDRYYAPYIFVDRGYAMMSKYIDIFGLTISPYDYVKLGSDRDQVLPSDFEEKLYKLDAEIELLEQSKKAMTQASMSRIETMIEGKIGKFVSSVHEVLTDGPYRNTHNAAISYRSGARGNVANIASATSLVGQMFSGSNRFNPLESRASYYADPGSNSIFDKSFIAVSYAQGLSPPAVMQVANPARAQALATYLGTPESGEAARKTELHQNGIHVNNTLSLVGRDGKIMDALAGYGCDGTKVTYRDTPLGRIESPIDPISILNKIKARRQVR